MGLGKERNQERVLKRGSRRLGNWHYIVEREKTREGRPGAGWKWGCAWLWPCCVCNASRFPSGAVGEAAGATVLEPQGDSESRGTGVAVTGKLQRL